MGRGHPFAGARRLRPAALAALILLAVPIVVACSPSDTSGGEPVATTEVQLPRSYRFAPAAITVPVGATVTWTNDDNFTHTVQVDGFRADEDVARRLDDAHVRPRGHVPVRVHAASAGHAGHRRGHRLLTHTCRGLSGTAD